MAATIHTHPLETIPGSLPADVVPKDVGLNPLPSLVEDHLSRFSASNLTVDVLWRDFFSFTGSVRTLSGRERIAKTWARLVEENGASGFVASQPTVNRAVPGSSWVDVQFTFNLSPKDGLPGAGSGSVSLVPDGERGWKIWVVKTLLEGFDGLPHPDVLEMDEQAEKHKIASLTTINGIEDSTNNTGFASHTTTNCIANHHTANGIANHTILNGEGGLREFEVIIVGGGQNGLCLARRLQALGISYVLLEQNSKIGDNWSGKYDSVKQHTVKDFSGLPFARTFGPSEPMFLTGRQVAEGYRRYVRRYHINAWTSTAVTRCTLDEEAQRWTVEAIHDGVTHTLRSHYLGVAIGGGVGAPRWPSWPGQDLYTGTLLHSKDFKNCAGWEGKKAIVVGSGTSAHDCASDMVKGGLDVTMIQRDKTAVFPAEWVAATQAGLYNEHIPVPVADRLAAGPRKIGSEMARIRFRQAAAEEKERFAALERAGFHVDYDAHLMGHIFGRFGSYYIDVGASAMIADGSIKVRSGVPVTTYTKTGIAFSDGTTLDADIIIIATGFQPNYPAQVSKLIGKGLAGRIGPVWGLDAEGEVQGTMRTVGGMPLYLILGDTATARWDSRWIALQIQAELAGKPFKSADV